MTKKSVLILKSDLVSIYTNNALYYNYSITTNHQRERLMGLTIAKLNITERKMKPKSIYSILLSTLLTMSASLSTAGDGGSDTGAGHVIGSTSVTPYEITSLILRSKEAAKYVIRGYEAVTYINYSAYTGVSVQDLQDLQNKLYNGPKTFSEALREANLKPIDQGACFDKDGNQVEASAINAPDLCFDPVMISKRVNNDNAQVEVLALVLHEVAHMIIGTSEDEAIKLQEMVRDHSMKNPIDKIPETVQRILNKFNYALKSHIHQEEDSKNNQVVKTKKIDNKIFLSAILTNLYRDIDLLRMEAPNFNKDGFAILTKNEDTKLNVAWYKTLNAFTFSFPGDYTNNTLAIYGKNKQILASDFAVKFYKLKTENQEIFKSIYFPFDKYSIRKITPNDSKTFTLEMNEIEKLLKEVYVSINAK